MEVKKKDDKLFKITYDEIILVPLIFTLDILIAFILFPELVSYEIKIEIPFTLVQYLGLMLANMVMIMISTLELLIGKFMLIKIKDFISDISSHGNPISD